ncbi:hypothetical protein [Marinilactibacillus sp. Marseille-P9653]|uniref:hypothetical protein n=1 Tax=Marinilactibacillus sp. Marseille-P9653 TaxID=2866583 RepID=UPI001CE4953D|nr:hypothetical protein [Marinilactibacillus sp. Marseille-P9653]
MGLLIIIGLALIVYGGISLKYPKQLKRNQQTANKKQEKYWLWYNSIYVIGSVVSLIVGVLLVLAGIVFYR